VALTGSGGRWVQDTVVKVEETIDDSETLGKRSASADGIDDRQRDVTASGW
jgi:hypothetical protein